VEGPIGVAFVPHPGEGQVVLSVRAVDSEEGIPCHRAPFSPDGLEGDRQSPAGVNPGTSGATLQAT
jgi:hypothetical protein